MSDDTGRILAAIAELEAYAEHGLASVDLASAPIISRWQLSRDLGGWLHLVGYVSGHDLLPRRPTDNDLGRRIGTSPLLYADMGAGVVRTLSRWYRLGECANEDDRLVLQQVLLPDVIQALRTRLSLSQTGVPDPSKPQ